MGEQKNKKVSEEDALKEAEAMLKMLENQKEKAVTSDEVTSDMEKNEEQKDSETEKQKDNKSGELGVESSGEKVEENESETKSNEESVHPERSRGASSAVKKKSAKVKAKGPKIRSKKYQEKYALVDRSKFYSFDEALELVKKTSYVKFDASVEMHVRLVAPKTKKTKQEQIRNTVQLPHSIGKEPKVGIVDEAMAEQILKDKSTDFDILLATPAMMPKIARLAKILGPQGKMPNPKTGTVTTDVEKTLKEIKSGRVEYKSDDTGNIHQMIGKVSFDNKKLEENYRAIISAISVSKIQSIVLSATMGPGVKVKL
ncbi:MAG: 50S ribosomal protein L1 [uncultured bacterium]|nr:MAG: 50S ribosomal protein L1 [uncultured bacterium]